ncbi:MAG: hypothetical protein EA408_02025 [Marinilabiliales bacterium]|nr:MAG: hypothetical protein EA408_02025 [Marinilabiliales bacterium]
MRNLGLLIMFLSVLVIISCDKDEDEVSERFRFLTSVEWESDQLLVNSEDASGPGEMLEDFKGSVKFNEDGTGSFGQYSGTWQFAKSETELVITTEALGFPLTTIIHELTKTDLKVATAFPNPANPEEPLNIEMSFKAK